MKLFSKQWRLWTLFKLFILAVLTPCVIFLVYMSSRSVHYVFVNEHYATPCNLPALDPFDPSIKQYFWKPDPVHCLPIPSIVYVNEYNVLNINESALGFFGLKKLSEVSCTAESVYRDGDDYHVGFNIPRMLTFPATLDTDFTRVKCWSPAKKSLFDNIVASMSKRVRNGSSIGKESEEQLSVLMFGIDSMSRSAAVRHLPNTVAVLQELGSYDFRGLMKNGDNTIPNIMAQQTGLKLYAEAPGFEANEMDRWPYLWKNFSAQNYVTMFGEDLPWLGMFNNGYKGFTAPPTDHYMRPFWLALGKEEKVAYHMGNVFKYLENKGLTLKTSELCNQNTMNHVELLNYIKRFFLRYKNKRRFALTFLTELSHNYINFLHHGDDNFKNFIVWLKDEGFLESTVVVLFSDHGSRFEDIRNTFVGRMESRMPMMHILLPEHLKKKYPNVDANMKTNTMRLVSHYDVHQTMLDVLNKNFKNPSTQIYNGTKRGVSLFQEVSSSRSCVEAHIPADFCACYKSRPVNITDQLIINIARGIADHVNKLVEEESKCRILQLNRILSAQQLSQGLKYFGTQHNGYSLFRWTNPEKSRDSYAVIIETVPGFATFDASVELEPSGKIYSVKNVDRTNAYGNQSACISNKRLKQYCYC